MSFFGGDLGENESFKNILSIGYEFETHDLAKLSLSDGELVNSGITTREMSTKVVNTSANKIDDNNYEVIDEESGLYYTEYYDEYDGVANDYVYMNVTNDIGTSNFYTLLRKHCDPYSEDESISKNDMYVFKTNTGNELNIKFDSLLLSQYCAMFSGVEYVITYLKIQRSKNIILETFLNACHRIFTHLKDVEKIPGQLFMKDSASGEETQIGHLENRLLYHKPNTNLYYLQTHDTEYHYKDSSIGMSQFIPQMTFRADSRHVLSIIKDILHNTDLKTSRQTKKMIQDEYNAVLDVEKCIEGLFEAYNKNTKNKQIPKHLKIRIFGFLFMIFYKMYMYLHLYVTTDMTESENYFKRYLSFYARHDNFMFYRKIKEIMLPVFKEKTAATILELVNQPEILATYIYTTRRLRKALKTTLTIEEADYGNPYVSFLSYFNHFEHFKPNENKESNEDWFMSADIDVYSTHFDMPDDGSIIIENRLFMKELTAYANDNLGVYGSGSFSLNNLKNIYRKLITANKVEDLSKKELNPKTMRFVNKCKPGQYRDEQFVCKTVKRQKSNRKTKKNKARK
jgi:hypothetical protein